MWLRSPRDSSRRGVAAMVATSVAGLVATGQVLEIPDSPSRWNTSAAFAISETYDTNVYLQNVTDLAFRESFVTTLSPSISATYKLPPAFTAFLSYSPDVVVFHSEHSEDHVTHRLAANLSGSFDDGTWAWESKTGIVIIDGSGLCACLLPGGDIPAIGGIPLRDRRDALIVHQDIAFTRFSGAWMVRPVAGVYVHDFWSEQHPRTGEFAYYINCVDRWEASAGIDLGHKAFANGWLLLGYRFGHQEQGELLGVISRYSNNFHRLLIGAEGSVTEWMKVKLAAGPDWRDFSSNPNPAFDADEVLFYFDTSVTLTPTAQDAVTLTAKRYEQPAFAGHSVYEDIVYDVSWRRKATDRLVLMLGLRSYTGAWQPPAVRNDRILTTRVVATYSFRDDLTGEFGFLYDRAKSRVPDTTARDYTRKLFSAQLRYAF